MFKKIVVPLDGSDIAERALQPALTLAQAADAAVVLLSIPFPKHAFVHEFGGSGLIYPEQSLDLCRKELTAYLEQLEKSKRFQSVSVRSEVIDGDAASVIVDTAVAEEADLIVMSTHGRSGFTRWMMGSVAEKVLRGAHCPVLVVRNDKPMKNILITVDGSPLSEEALWSGFNLAQRFEGKVTLLKVLEVPVDVAGAVAERSRLLVGHSNQHRKARQDHAKSYLTELKNRYAPEGVDTECAITESHLIAEGIRHFAISSGIDLIVMTTHGYTGLKRWAYGSVTGKIIHDAKCSLLVVHLPDHKFTKDKEIDHV